MNTTPFKKRLVSGHEVRHHEHSRTPDLVTQHTALNAIPEEQRTWLQKTVLNEIVEELKYRATLPNEAIDATDPLLCCAQRIVENLKQGFPFHKAFFQEVVVTTLTPVQWQQVTNLVNVLRPKTDAV